MKKSICTGNGPITRATKASRRVLLASEVYAASPTSSYVAGDVGDEVSSSGNVREARNYTLKQDFYEDGRQKSS